MIAVRPGGDGIDSGSRWRGRVLTAIGVLIALLALTGLAVDRRADRRVDRLQADLMASYADTTSGDVLPATGDSPADRVGPSVPAATDLAASDGTAPDLVTVAGSTVKARYTLGRRCLVATWTQSSFAVVDGSDQQCAASLTLD